MVNYRFRILVNRQNIFVLQLCHSIGLTTKACQEDALLIGFGIIAGNQHFYRYSTHPARLLSQINRSHTPAPDDMLKSTCAKRNAYQFFYIHIFLTLSSINLPGPLPEQHAFWALHASLAVVSLAGSVDS